MRLKLIYILLLSGCVKIKPEPIGQVPVIEASFHCEMPGCYEVQKLNLYGHKWVIVYRFDNVSAGDHVTDSIPYVPGLYRIKGENDSTDIINVK